MNKDEEILRGSGGSKAGLDGIREVNRAGPESGIVAVVAEGGVGRADRGWFYLYRRG